MKSYLAIVIFIFLASYIISIENNNNQWQLSSPQEEGLREKKVEKLVELSFEDSSTMAIVLVKNGKIVAEKYANGYSKESKGTSWSVAKSFYAALIGIAIEKKEITSLDDKVSDYLDYFQDDRKEITIRQLLSMSSGLDYPDHQHEMMFFERDQLNYAANVLKVREPGNKFEYNNVNSMVLGDLISKVSEKSAKKVLENQVLIPLGIENYSVWTDNRGNTLTYCCIDLTARDYAKFGLLIAQEGFYNGQQIIPKKYLEESLSPVWQGIYDEKLESSRGYGLHWWISNYSETQKLFTASGRFGQYIFVDQEQDLVFVRITKYLDPNFEDNRQDLGWIYYLRYLGSMKRIIWLGNILERLNIIEPGNALKSPVTFKDGTSTVFFK